MSERTNIKRDQAVIDAIRTNTPPQELAAQLGISVPYADRLISNKLASNRIGIKAKEGYTQTLQSRTRAATSLRGVQGSNNAARKVPVTLSPMLDKWLERE